MTCILCSLTAMSGRKYCLRHQVRAEKQSLVEKVAEQRAAKLRQIELTIENCKQELALNFDCPSEQILGFYGAKLRITGKEMLDAIGRYNERRAEAI